MGVYNATVITNAGQNLIASAIAGGEPINFTAVKTSTHVYPAGTSLQNLTSLSDVKQTVAPTGVDVYNNNVVQISARVPNTGIATAYLINTIGLFGSAGGAETLIAVLTAQTPDEVPVFDAEAPAAFIFNVQMTLQNADEVVFEVNDTGTATVADLNRVAQPFTGATASAAGSAGRVPVPAAGANKKFLCGDGTWTAPADMVEDFTSSDVADGSATAWTSVDALTSGENNKNIFAKISQMFKNIRFLYANGIKNITRSGTTFTATRINGTTFTFDQQDNNTTYALASTSANGLLRALNGSTSNYLRGDGTWQTPPNTWRGIQNNLTSTSTTDSLAAAQGKALNDKLTARTNGSVAANTTYCTSGNVYWTKVPGIRIASLYFDGYLKTGINTSNVAVFASGLPKAAQDTMVMCSYGTAFGMVRIDSSGILKPWYMGSSLPASGGNHYFGSIVYITAD